MAIFEDDEDWSMDPSWENDGIVHINAIYCEYNKQQISCVVKKQVPATDPNVNEPNHGETSFSVVLQNYTDSSGDEIVEVLSCQRSPEEAKQAARSCFVPLSDGKNAWKEYEVDSDGDGGVTISAQSLDCEIFDVHIESTTMRTTVITKGDLI